ncbi:MAG: hypothetical protein GXO94_00800 [Nitrospirae bacterium]|nr:hypothetical protein [Nitrospirota bacterium]
MKKGQSDGECERLREEIARLRKVIAGLTPPLETLLRRRGFRIFKKEPAEDLLVPGKRHIDSYYETMKRYSFRLFLRDAIKHQDEFTYQSVTRYATAEVTGDYIDYLLKVGLLEEVPGGFRLKKRPVKSFGATLEWFVAEVLKREFGMETIWGVRFRGRKVGGDYDLIAKLDSGLLYMEVKSSPPRQVYASEISAFWSRTEDLCPDIAVFLMDTHLRMKDKLVVMFEEELARRFETPPVVRRLKAEIFRIEDRVFIMNSKPSVEGNMETLLSYYLRRRCL